MDQTEEETQTGQGMNWREHVFYRLL